MEISALRRGLADRLVSRRGARMAIGVALVLVVVTLGLLGRADPPGNGPAAPADSESAQAAQLLAEFPDADEQSVLVVATRADGGTLGQPELDALQAVQPRLEQYTGLGTSGPMVSDDERAALLVVTITAGADNTENVEAIEGVRDVVGQHAPDHLELLVTGGPAFGADVAAAFDGADLRLLVVTIAIVALLLIVTYRSPILWLVPLTVVGIADQVAGRATAALGEAWGLYFDAGIISVLVFGAGTNYALLLTSRYREQLRVEEDHRVALAKAWRLTMPAIVASNVTVVLALLTLVFAVIPGTRGLGVAAAAGLFIALAAVLLVLPPALAMCGRRVFWPFVPRPGSDARQGRAWRAVASTVVHRPLVALGAGLVVLVVMASGLLTTSVGLTQAEKFRVPSESQAGLEVLASHFDPGEAQPVLIVTTSAAADQVVTAATQVDGVVRANPAGTSADGTLTRVMVTGAHAPGTPEALDMVADLRQVVHDVPEAEALVGGGLATDLDAREGNQQDLLVVAPLVLAVSFVVLVLLLRSLVAPVLLLFVNVVSSAAAIGAGAWLSSVVFDQHALDLQVPLLAFLFLVALGIDYTIFLVHRARAEAAVTGTRQGMVDAVAHTGGVITSAGIVLAGVFAALGVLPLVTLGQLGLIVGVGVIVDAMLVRSTIVPALFGLIGDRIWWPRHDHAEWTDEHQPTPDLVRAG